MPVVKQKWITRDDLKRNPEHLFAFGDNMARRGLGGQAKEMRGEPNAVGVPTKWEPTMYPSGFFSEAGLGTGLAALDGRAPSIAALIQAHIEALDTVTKGGE